jgi:hypothetical protein
MGFKAVTIAQNSQNVLVGWVPEEAAAVSEAQLQSTVFENQACPEPSAEIRRFIDMNPNRSFDLHKYVDGQIVCRTVVELQVSEFTEWQYNWQPAEVIEEGE